MGDLREASEDWVGELVTFWMGGSGWRTSAGWSELTGYVGLVAGLEVERPDPLEPEVQRKLLVVLWSGIGRCSSHPSHHLKILRGSDEHGER